MMSVLSMDLIANVLVRLSIKDMTQLKVVRKGWNEVLSSVEFCQSYDSYMRPIRYSYILYLDFPSMSFIEFDPILKMGAKRLYDMKYLLRLRTVGSICLIVKS